jgi:hypothetical protein
MKNRLKPGDEVKHKGVTYVVEKPPYCARCSGCIAWGKSLCDELPYCGDVTTAKEDYIVFKLKTTPLFGKFNDKEG